MMNDLDQDSSQDNEQREFSHPASAVVYSFDMVGLHGVGFVVPQSLSEVVERIAQRFGLTNPAAALLVLGSSLIITFCIISFLCNALSSIKPG